MRQSLVYFPHSPCVKTEKKKLLIGYLLRLFSSVFLKCPFPLVRTHYDSVFSMKVAPKNFILQLQKKRDRLRVREKAGKMMNRKKNEKLNKSHAIRKVNVMKTATLILIIINNNYNKYNICTIINGAVV